MIPFNTVSFTKKVTLMNRLVVCIFCLVLTPVSIIKAAESLNSELSKCSTMDRDLLRLACYDRLAGKASSFAEEAVSANAIKAEIASSSTNMQKTSNFGLKEIEKTPTPVSSPNFGLKVSEDEAEDTLRSSIVGEFKGWRRNDILSQVWKVTDSRARLFYKATNPEITITRNTMGSYRISLVGTNQSTFVRRIK